MPIPFPVNRAFNRPRRRTSNYHPGRGAAGGGSAASPLIPPQALEAEQSTLGAMIIERAAIVKVLELLSADDFYRQIHRDIFEIIVDLYAADESVDLITVTGEARRRGQIEEIGGAAYLTALIEACPSAANVESYARNVLETSNKRRWAEVSERLGAMSYNGVSATEIAEYCFRQAEVLSERSHSGPPATLTADALMTMELSAPEWIVSELIGAGLTILAGKPKIGKSWLALDLAIAVASGGKAFGSVDVEQGDVLYLALEDTLWRLQRRLNKLLQGAPAPKRLHLAVEWGRLDTGAAAQMERWLKEHPGAKMIIVDTLQKVRPKREQGNNYGNDYDDMEVLKRVADKYGVALVVVTHVRKLAADDPIDSVSGTLGLSGGADTILVLNRRRGQRKGEGTLFVGGRDPAETQYAMNWDETLLQWAILGEGEEVALSREREEIIGFLRENVGPMRAREIAALRGGNESAAYQLLWLMSKDGLIRNDGDGLFSACNGAPPVSEQPPPAQPPTEQPPQGKVLSLQSDEDLLTDVAARCRLDLATAYWQEHRAPLIAFAREWNRVQDTPLIGPTFDAKWPQWLRENGDPPGQAPPDGEPPSGEPPGSEPPSGEPPGGET